MSLTGYGFLLLLVFLTVGSFAGAVIALPGVSQSRVRPILARVTILLSVNALTLLTAAVALNDQFTFFADWTDLRGTIFGAPVASTSFAGAPAAAAANAPVGGATAIDRPPALPSLPPGASRNDRVLRFSVTGARSRLRGTVLVTLPDGYTDKANRARRYPVLETFHGYPGTPEQWTYSMDLGGALDKAVASRTAGPIITISPTLEFPPGVDTECVDGGEKGPAVETWLTQDVPEWVLRNLRVRTDRASWATIGLSAGAWCAAMATMLHPDRYAAGIIMGGYFSPDFSANYKPFGAKNGQAHHYDLISLARDHPPSVALWVETSHSDPISFPSTSRLLAVSRAPLSIQALVLTHAGHRLSLWRDELAQVLPWLGKSVAGFAP